MAAIDVAQRYLQAWNDHDPTAIVAAFAEGGTYTDPAVPKGLTGPAIGEYARGLFEAFPDLSFDIQRAAQTTDRTVVAQWLMRGTNTGPMQGNPPTGGTIALPGADVIEIDGDQVHSVQGYFDQKNFVEQLGLQAIVVPVAMGPVTFGSSARMATGKRTKPGAISLTWIDVRSEEEEREVRNRTLQVLAQMAEMPGFISWLGATVQGRMITVTAWDSPESAAHLLRGGPHKDAMDRVFSGTLGTAGFTSVWAPEHLNALLVHCPECGTMERYERSGGTCQCGAALPEPPPYW
jgi:steroid delta-isomerase-like uncharacterized protein